VHRDVTEMAKNRNLSDSDFVLKSVGFEFGFLTQSQLVQFSAKILFKFKGQYPTLAP